MQNLTALVITTINLRTHICINKYGIWFILLYFWDESNIFPIHLQAFVNVYDIMICVNV